MNKGIIKISLQTLYDALALPPAYKPTAAYINPLNQVIAIIVEGEDIPTTEEGQRLPQLRPLYTSSDVTTDQYECAEVQLEGQTNE